MIQVHYLIYSESAEEERRRLDLSDLAIFRLSREHTGGRVFKVFKNLMMFRPRRCKKHREDGILNNVYIVTGKDELVLEISRQKLDYQDLDPERIVRIRMNSRDKSISTKCIFNKEEPWETI